MFKLTTSLILLSCLVNGQCVQAQELAEGEASDDSAVSKVGEKTEAEWLAIGDQRVNEKKYTAALLAYKSAYETIVARFRGRDFKEPVKPRFMTRPELQEYMLKEFKTEVNPDEMRFMDRTLKVFGFAPMELDVEQTLLSLYTEEVAGFYNPRTKEIFLIQENRKKGSTIGIFKKLLGFREFNKDEQKTTLAHEMTHALADQHFDLKTLSDAVAGNDDMALAMSALIEGEATLLMLGEMLSDNHNKDAIWEVRTAQVEATFGFAAGAAMVFGGRTMRRAPAIFRKTLMFPYHKGTVFVVHLGRNSDWSGIDRAFKDPPISTEQILHPEKYMGKRDHPTVIDFPSSQTQLGDQWSILGDNSLGELQIRILLNRQRDGTTAAAGWDGDRFEVYENKDGHLGLAWYLVWDSERDAAEFIVSYRDHNGIRWMVDGEEQLYEVWDDSARERLATDSNRAVQAFSMELDGTVNVIVQQGEDVWVVEGFSADETNVVLNNLGRAYKAPLQLKIK
jgi:hypothetical protein